MNLIVKGKVEKPQWRHYGALASKQQAYVWAGYFLAMRLVDV
jgi:hypothetical protein